MPQAPQNPCTETAPTTSSTRNLFNTSAVNTTIKPPIKPEIIADKGEITSTAAVTDTKPPKAPFTTTVIKKPLRKITNPMTEPRMPLIAPKCVFKRIVPRLEKSLLTEPPLNPNQPNHRIKPPIAT